VRRVHDPGTMRSRSLLLASLTTLLACAPPPSTTSPTPPAVAPAPERALTPHLQDRLRFWLPADAGAGEKMRTPPDVAATIELSSAPCERNRLLLEARDWGRQGRDLTAQLAYLELHPRQVTVDEIRGVRQLRPVWPYLSDRYHDHHFVGGAIATFADGSIASVTAWLAEAPGDELTTCLRLAHEILGSVRTGDRTLDLRGGRVGMPTGYQVDLPPGWRLVEQPELRDDRASYLFAPLRAVENSGPWLELVFMHPRAGTTTTAALDERRPFVRTAVGDPAAWARDIHDWDPGSARTFSGVTTHYLASVTIKPLDEVTPVDYRRLLDIAESVTLMPGGARRALVEPRRSLLGPTATPPLPLSERPWLDLVWRGQQWLEQMPVEARTSFEEACRKDVRGCRLAGVWLVTHGAHADGLAYLERACRGDRRACQLAEVARSAGDDSARALCLEQDADGCAAAVENAAVWLGRCQGGDVEACEGL
jgi:hypothetical protein